MSAIGSTERDSTSATGSTGRNSGITGRDSVSIVRRTGGKSVSIIRSIGGDSVASLEVLVGDSVSPGKSPSGSKGATLSHSVNPALPEAPLKFLNFIVVEMSRHTMLSADRL